MHLIKPFNFNSCKTIASAYCDRLYTTFTILFYKLWQFVHHIHYSVLQTVTDCTPHSLFCSTNCDRLYTTFTILFYKLWQVVHHIHCSVLQTVPGCTPHSLFCSTNCDRLYTTFTVLFYKQLHYYYINITTLTVPHPSLPQYQLHLGSYSLVVAAQHVFHHSLCHDLITQFTGRTISTHPCDLTFGCGTDDFCWWLALQRALIVVDCHLTQETGTKYQHSALISDPWETKYHHSGLVSDPWETKYHHSGLVSDPWETKYHHSDLISDSLNVNMGCLIFF